MQETFTLAIEQETPASQPDNIATALPLDQIISEIKTRVVMVVENAAIAGWLLIEAKKRVGHDNFGAWVEDTFIFSHSTANNFMAIAQKIPASLYGRISYSQAVSLLPLPSSEDIEKFALENDVFGKSSREIKRLVKATKEAEHAAKEAEEKLKQAESQLATQTQIATRQQILVEQYSQQYYNENERANQLEAQLQNARNEMPDPIEVEVVPADYEQIKAKAAQEKQRADEAEAYAMEQESALQRTQNELRKMRETKADQPLSGNSPLSLDSFSSTIKQFITQVGIAPNMAPFFRAMGPDTLRAYSQWVDVLEEWIIGTKEAIGEGTQYVDAHESAVV